MRILEIDGIRFDIRKREGKHNRGHVHIILGGYEAVFFLDTGKEESNTFKGNDKRRVRKLFNENLEALREAWETRHES